MGEQTKETNKLIETLKKGHLGGGGKGGKKKEDIVGLVKALKGGERRASQKGALLKAYLARQKKDKQRVYEKQYGEYMKKYNKYYNGWFKTYGKKYKMDGPSGAAQQTTPRGPNEEEMRKRREERRKRRKRRKRLKRKRMKKRKEKERKRLFKMGQQIGMAMRSAGIGVPQPQNPQPKSATQNPGEKGLQIPAIPAAKP